MCGKGISTPTTPVQGRYL